MNRLRFQRQHAPDEIAGLRSFLIEQFGDRALSRRDERHADAACLHNRMVYCFDPWESMPVPTGEQTYRVSIARSAAGGISTGTQQFEVKLEDRMTVLDALFRIQREQDASLSFRCACRVGMCGTCAVSVNGIPRLACKTQIGRASCRERV